MKSKLLFLFLFLISISYGQVGIRTATPDAQLDIRSSNQAAPANNDGILIPKVNVFPAINPTVAQQGMLVYLTTPTAFGGNPKPIGFYYWDNGTTDWIGISTSINGDHDWYKVGTTLAPSAITDDMFHTGNVAIGKNSANYPLEVNTINFDIGINNTLNNNSNNFLKATSNTLSSSGNGTHAGTYNLISGNGTGIQTGVFNEITNTSSLSQSGVTNMLTNLNSSSKYGISTLLSGNGPLIGDYVYISNSTNTQTGFNSYITTFNTATGNIFGVNNTIQNSGSGLSYGVKNNINDLGSGTKYGVYNDLTNTGTGNQYGVLNKLVNSSDVDLIGTSNEINGNGAFLHTGEQNVLQGTSDGPRLGVGNYITVNGNGVHTGTINNILGNGSGEKKGVVNTISSTNATAIYGTKTTLTGTLDMYGSKISLINNGTSGLQTITGSSIDISGTTASAIKGTDTQISVSGGSAMYGNYSSITSTAVGTGPKYGSFNLISTTAGGDHYGVYSSVLKSGTNNFAGYFLGNVGIGTTNLNTYILPPSRAVSAGQIMQTNATGNVTWQTPATALNSFSWLTTGNSGLTSNFLGTTDANPIILRTTNVERMRITPAGNVGIGTNAPGFPLEVNSALRSINSITTSATNSSVTGFNTAAAGISSSGFGVLGQTNQSGSQGIRGEQINASGFAVFGINFGANGANGGGGIYAQTSQSNGYGSDSRNINANGTGVFGIGNNVAGNYLIAGSGGAFNGVTTGIYSNSTTVGIGESIYTSQFGNTTRVNYWSGTTQYKIIGIGTVSTTAENLNGERVTLHCTEAPEIYFEDYGQGQLLNGKTHIEIDPIIAKNIIVNEKHPLRVYIQLEDDCNGVFVTNKTGNSFDVTELLAGQSNAKFQYHIIGNRADEILPNGRISKNADTRFELAPKNNETKEAIRIDTSEPTSSK